MERKKLYSVIEGSKRNTSEPFKQFFTIEPGCEKVLLPVDVQFCNFFAEVGEDLSLLPILCPLGVNRRKIADAVHFTDCHNFAREMLHAYVMHHPQVEAKLYYGYVDIYNGSIYLGMYSHSFLTLLINNERTIFDPLLIKCIGDENKTLITSHFGVPLSHEYVISMFPQNYSRHLRETVFESKIKTKTMISVLQKYSERFKVA